MAQGKQPSMAGDGFKVRVSSRAKHVRLTLSARDGLIIVVPQGYDQRRIPELLALESSRKWLQRATARLAARRPQPVDCGADVLPAQVDLLAVSEVWLISYRRTRSPDLTARASGSCRLLVSGATDNHAGCRAVLRLWLRAKARRELGRRLTEIADELGVEFSRISVRQQRSRWGSCSTQGSINLNLKLLFLPPELVRYVLIHELCHLTEPNHSAAFWQLVGMFLPDYVELRRALRTAGRYVPGWLEEAGEGILTRGRGI